MDAPENRPHSVTLTIWGVFLLGGWNFGRLLTLWLNFRLLTTFATTPSPLFRLILAAVWTVVLWSVSLTLWQKRSFTRRAIPSILIIYMIVALGILLTFSQSGLARSGWLLRALFYLVCISFSYWALNRAAVQSYFGD